MKRSIRSIGMLGESLACKYLEEKGYGIRDRNFQNAKGYKYGEIDIVAIKDDLLVFVEVKTRLAKKGETIIPEENISPSKLRNLEKIASTYLNVKNVWNMPYRFDAVSILLDLQEKSAKVRHLENIFF